MALRVGFGIEWPTYFMYLNSACSGTPTGLVLGLALARLEASSGRSARPPGLGRPVWEPYWEADPSERPTWLGGSRISFEFLK